VFASDAYVSAAFFEVAQAPLERFVRALKIVVWINRESTSGAGRDRDAFVADIRPENPIVGALTID